MRTEDDTRVYAMLLVFRVSHAALEIDDNINMEYIINITKFNNFTLH